MRQYSRLNILAQNYSGELTVTALSTLLLEDLKNCCCFILGTTEDEVSVVLAELKIVSETLDYDIFDQRIAFTVAGEIVNDQFVPLTYNTKGKIFGFQGRCSTLPQVCGVDLYLSSSYTGKTGDRVHQKFSVSEKIY